MKKERNTFFQSAGMTTQATYPQMPMQQPMMQPMQQPMMQQPMQQYPTVAGQSTQSYYQGPEVMNTNQLDNIEKAINRLDARVTKLENQMHGNSKDYTTNMHMV